MEDPIIDLTDFDHDEIAMRINRVSNFLIDNDPNAEGYPLSEGDQYREDMEYLTDWVNSSDDES